MFNHKNLLFYLKKCNKHTIFLCFLSLGSAEEPANFQAAPAPDFFSQAAPAPRSQKHPASAPKPCIFWHMWANTYSQEKNRGKNIQII